jgi:uncharacterized protein YacL
MKLAVTDANIFIDLIHIEWIDHVFALEVEIHTALEVFEELNDRQQQILAGFQTRGFLYIHSLSDSDRTEMKMVKVPRALSEADGVVVFLAKKLNAEVLTGDGPLRKHCLAEKIEVHGILWLIDTFLDMGLTTPDQCAACLERLMLYNNRLPVTECEQRLRRWKV